MLNAVIAPLLALTSAVSGPSKKQDGFKDVRCGSDIPMALIGRTIPNERVVVIEARHKDLGLKDLGATEISGNLSVISWLICGSEYMLIEDQKNVIRDVLKVPPHSKDTPLFIGTGQLNDKELPDAIVAILKNDPGIEMLPASSAWRIDEKTAKFVIMPTAGLRCPRGGIITRDGGR